jgi:ABC-type sugar transport system ATPase subunit
VLSLKNICKSFGPNIILDDISIDILDREFLVLVGPSGSGKSTLIRIIAGLVQHDSGEILFQGEDIGLKAPKDRCLSMVFQNYALYPHKTVYENISFPLEISGCEKNLVKPKVNKIAQKLNIAELLDRKPGQLSGGQRQRVALARAMAKDPKIFLLDEPLSNLDAKLRAKMRKEIFSLHKDSDATFVYVTHDQIEALTLGDRVVVLDAGKIQQIGTPHEIYNNPQNTFVASFIGNPPSNLLTNMFSERIVGIRPEFFKLSASTGDDIEIEVSLKNIELIGSDYLLYLETREHAEEIIAKLPSSKDLDSLYRNHLMNKEEYNFSLFVSENLLYYFSKANGARLREAVSKEL